MFYNYNSLVCLLFHAISHTQLTMAQYTHVANTTLEAETSAESIYRMI